MDAQQGCFRKQRWWGKDEPETWKMLNFSLELGAAVVTALNQIFSI